MPTEATAALAVAESDDCDRRWPTSPARSALAEHLELIFELKVETGRRGRPLALLRDQLERARQQVAAARAEIEEVATSRAAAIADAACAADGDVMTLPPAPANEKMQIRLATAERTEAAVLAAMRDCEVPYQEAATTLGRAQAQTDLLVLAVIEEMHAAALDRLAISREAYVAAEAEVLAITRLFGEHGRGEVANRVAWLRAGERASTAYGKEPVAEATMAAVMARVAVWLAVMPRLFDDAAASG